MQPGQRWQPKMLMMQRQSRIRHAAGCCESNPGRQQVIAGHEHRQIRSERITIYDDVLW